MKNETLRIITTALQLVNVGMLIGLAAFRSNKLYFLLAALCLLGAFFSAKSANIL